jgi:CheY-like chemotaxis protein
MSGNNGKGKGVVFTGGAVPVKDAASAGGETTSAGSAAALAETVAALAEAAAASAEAAAASAEAAAASAEAAAASAEGATSAEGAEDAEGVDSSGLVKNEGIGAVSGAQKIILAVDNSAFFLRTLELMLKGSGYKVICVNSGKAALEFLKKRRPPSLFIFDIEMPLLNGYDLAKRVQELGYKVPIIFLTGNAKEEHIREAARVGAADYIVKPLNKEQVMERINKLIGP